MTTAMIQMNTRIRAEEKLAGDKALREAGFTPSGAIRALWRKAARGGRDLREVATLLGDSAVSAVCAEEMPSPIGDSVAPSTAPEGVSPLVRGRQLVPAFFEGVGMLPGTSAMHASDAGQSAFASPFDKEIEAALAERYKERGLL